MGKHFIQQTQGEELENDLETIDLVCINSGCVTRLASRFVDEDSVIGLTLVSISALHSMQLGRLRSL
jgi:hypothetical protein